MCPAVVPCATADEESGSSLKTWILCGSTLRVTRYKKTGFGNVFFQNEPLHKIWLSAKVNFNLILELPCALYFVYTPPWVWLDLLSTFVLTPSFIFTEEDLDFVPDDAE